MSPPGSTRGERWRRLVAPGLATLVVFAILVTLGMWQLERRAWKEALVAQIESRAFGTPGELAAERDWPGWRALDDEFRRVRVEGVFDHAAETPIHGLMQDQPGRPVQGFYIFTPLHRDDGSVVMVNRGFVPTPLKGPALRQDGNPVGRVSLVGLVRAPEVRGWFVPENGPAGWFVRDPAALARAGRLERVAPFYIDADATPQPGGWPRGGQTRIVLANNHLQYALTWFGLGGTLLAVFGTFALRRWRGSGDELEAEDAGHDQADAGEPQGVRRVAE